MLRGSFLSPQVHMTPQSQKNMVAWLSVISNTVLIVFKITVGVVIGSVSVISEAIHSGVDLLASVIALVAVKTSAKPADDTHPFGHGKVENISGTIEALLIFLAAGWIVYEAVGKVLHPREIDAPLLGVAVMFASALANWGVSSLLFKVGKATDSVALQADGWHLRTDVYTSLGVLAGLAMISLGDTLLPKFGVTGSRLDVLHIIDPIAAIVVAGMIVRAAWKLTLQSGRDLLDVNLPEEEAWIKELLRSFIPQVRGFHRLRTRKAGAMRFIEFHIFVDGKMTVEDSHELAHAISRRIKEHLGECSVIVHVEPCSGRCEHNCRSGCLLSEEQRQSMHNPTWPGS